MGILDFLFRKKSKRSVQTTRQVEVPTEAIAAAGGLDDDSESAPPVAPTKKVDVPAEAIEALREANEGDNGD
jgi:hypothetical protein